MAGVSISWAQQPRVRPKVGYLSPFSATAGRPLFDAFRGGLREQGYNDGTDIDFEIGFADEHYERLPALASELISRKVDVSRSCR